MSHSYEQQKDTSTGHAWLILVLFSAGIVGWALLLQSTVRDGPRRWDFGQREDTPAAAFSSTHPTPRPKAVPRQIDPWPGSEEGATAPAGGR